MIRFYNQDVRLQSFCKLRTRKWLNSAISNECCKVGDINVIFCSDDFILDMNIQYLGHHYYTDVITFDYCVGKTLSGDIYISIDTVKDNASFYNASFMDELHRVIVHGVLHLIGYDDHSDEDISTMRSKENFYLSKRSDFFDEQSL